MQGGFFLLKKPLRRGASGVHLLGFCCSFSCARPARRSCLVAHRPCALPEQPSKSRCCRGSGLASSGELPCADKNGPEAPAPSRARSSMAAPQEPFSRQGRDTGAQRTAPGTANSFARLGMSVVCLIVFKVKLFGANYRQTWSCCELLKNNGLTTNIVGDPLDKIRGVAKSGLFAAFAARLVRFEFVCGPAGCSGANSRKCRAVWGRFGGGRGPICAQKSIKNEKNR